MAIWQRQLGWKIDCSRNQTDLHTLCTDTNVDKHKHTTCILQNSTIRMLNPGVMSVRQVAQVFLPQLVLPQHPEHPGAPLLWVTKVPPWICRSIMIDHFFQDAVSCSVTSDSMNASNHTHLIMVSPQNHSVLRFGPLYLTSWQLSPAMPGSSNMKLETVHCLAPFCQHSFCILNCF